MQKKIAEKKSMFTSWKRTMQQQRICANAEKKRIVLVLVIKINNAVLRVFLHIPFKV